MRTFLLACPLLVLSLGCGARSGLDVDPVEPFDADIARDGGTDAASDAGPDASVPPDIDAGCPPVDDRCGATELCDNGANDDCDDAVDEGCECEPGAVQSCFSGPPGRRDVGACQDGSQVCTSEGRWGSCRGGIEPNEDVCTGRDDLCNGCSDERICRIDCPSPGDPRVPDGVPFADYPLRGRSFYVGPAAQWRWQVEGGPCDGLAPNLTSFELMDGASEDATFIPRLSGDYRITLAVTTPAGDLLDCSWLVHVGGPGLRVEMCYPESETQDLDLFLHNPENISAWYAPGANAFGPLPESSCGWHNCEATLRLPTHPVTGAPVNRASWGYPDTSIDNCINGPQGSQWAALGACSNPRLDIDNNLSEGTGVPENINVDNPRDGDRFRIMVQNFTGLRARPLVNVYCAGRRVATYGQAPDVVRRYFGTDGNAGVGAMWRVADVTMRVDGAGVTVGCDVEPLHPPGQDSGYFVTYDDRSY